MREVQVLGVGMTAFGKLLDRGLKALGGQAVGEALADADVAAGRLEAAFVGNAMAGLVTGQECSRGQLPVNTSGGLLAKGHPVGATGIAQVVEVVEQLRGRAGARQVDGVRVALTQNAGGVLEGEPAACAVHIFRASVLEPR